MALVTTAGAADADSYAALTDANTYFTNRAVTAWTGTDAAKEAALRRATTYLDNQYRGKWIGIRTNEAQALAWPRLDGGRTRYGGLTEPLFDLDEFEIPTDTVPLQVQHATMEAALLVIGGVTLEPRLERGGAIKSIGKSVGPLRKDITYLDGATVTDRMLVIEGLLRGLVTGTPGSSSGNTRLVRA